MPELDEFALGFCEAMFFSESSCFHSSEFFGDEAQEHVDEGQADGSLPSDAGPEDLDAESLAAIVELCAAFQRDNVDLLNAAYERGYDVAQAGRDLYFTKAGHGVGYWDRSELESDSDIWADRPRIGELGRDDAAIAKAKEESLGERLSKAARGPRGFGAVDTTAYQDESAPSGFYVQVSMY